MAGVRGVYRTGKLGFRAVPYAYRPAVMLRRRALNDGVFGDSVLWKVVALGIFSRSTLKKSFGKHPERVDRIVLRPGGFVSVGVTKPVSRRAARKAGISLADLRAAAQADVDAART
jgi:hypothetical protein